MNIHTINILDLPPEITTEIFTYLPWFDFTEACLVCKLWMKIGQQHKFASKRVLSFTHCNLNDETEPGKCLVNSSYEYFNVKIGKSCYVTRNSEKLFQKFGKTATYLTLNGNLEWEHELLLSVLVHFPVLHCLEVGLIHSDQINTKKFVEMLFERRFTRVSLHGISQVFVESLLDFMKNCAEPLGTELSLNFNCDFRNINTFDTFFETLATTFPDKVLLELTVPFKLRALEMLSSVPLNFSSLSKLEITSPKSFEDLKKVCQLMPNLNQLVLWRGCLDFQLFDVFDCLVNLQTLRIQSGLRFTDVTRNFCENLQPKPKMRMLEMELIEGQINVEGFEKLIRAMSNLTHLMLNQSEIRDEHLMIICDNLLKLRILEMDSGKVTDTGMNDANWKNLRKLRKLKLDGGYNITNDGFSKFSSIEFLELRELKLNYFTKIDRSMTQKLTEACPYVEYLSLDGCSEIDDAAVEILAKKFKRLRQLDLYSCTKVTTKAMNYLMRNCNRLQLLDVSALNIDEDDKQELYKNISTLKYVYDYDDGIDKSKYFKGKTLRKRELYCTAMF